VASIATAGARPGDLIGVLAADRLDAAVSVIGVLRAGCGFVPLDRSLGAERLDAMIDECGLRFVVTDAVLRPVCDRWPAVTPIEAGRAARIGGVLGPAWRPADPCYVYFTSGSTGRPKGIAGRCSALEHFLQWEIDTLELQPGVRVSQLIGIGFDPYLRDLFVPLCAGGIVCIPPDEDTVRDGRRLVAWLAEERIEVVHCVPTVLRLILQELEARPRSTALRYVLACGEPLLPADVKRWGAVVDNGARLLNLYGPTETTLAKLAYVVDERDHQRRTIPIGAPIPGAAAVVLDTHGRPCPPGIAGELCLATPHRSHGYYRRGALTAQVFAPDPFGTGDVIYRTGDLARGLPNGMFEYVGRLDTQVKIRGRRVELGEVETILLEQDGVRGAAAAMRDLRGEPQLVAYFTGEADPSHLRRLLQRRLPAWMVPAAVERLDALPLLPNGKINRRALPAAPAAVVGQRQPPRSPQEAALCAIFAEVLGIDGVGVDDDFFELGGHSLVAVQLANRVRLRFGLELPLAQLLETPSVGEIAQRLVELREGSI
jgi:amino acid adenylation domain-containing protein